MLPPPKPEPLQLDVETELAVVAVADLEPGRTLEVRPRATGHRVRPAPESLEAPEQARVMRLKLRIRVASDG